MRYLGSRRSPSGPGSNSEPFRSSFVGFAERTYRAMVGGSLLFRSSCSLNGAREWGSAFLGSLKIFFPRRVCRNRIRKKKVVEGLIQDIVQALFLWRVLGKEVGEEEDLMGAPLDFHSGGKTESGAVNLVWLCRLLSRSWHRSLLGSEGVDRLRRSRS